MLELRNNRFYESINLKIKRNHRKRNVSFVSFKEGIHINIPFLFKNTSIIIEKISNEVIGLNKPRRLFHGL